MTARINLTVLVVVLLVLVGIFAVGGTVTGVLALRQSSDVSAQALEAADTAKESAKVAQEDTETLATNRRNSILENCKDQNERNEDTIHTLDLRIARVAKSVPPEELAQLKASRAFTVSLVNALAPHRDCKVVLERAGF